MKTEDFCSGANKICTANEVLPVGGFHNGGDFYQHHPIFLCFKGRDGVNFPVDFHTHEDQQVQR